MANEVLTFDADLSPLNWLLNGIQHFGAINDVSMGRNIWVVGPDVEDWVSMTDPAGSIDTLIEMRVTIKNRFVSADGAGGVVGCAYHILKSDDTQLGSYGLQMITNFSPHEYNIVIPLVGVGADTTNMKMRIRSFDVGGWPIGMGVIQTYQIIPTLYYTEPVAFESKSNVELKTTSGVTALSVGTGKMEVNTTNGKCSLAVGTGRVHLETER